MGVHWRNGAAPSHRYVIVSAEAVPSVLAHELGHYNGLGHSPTVDNLMSYHRSGDQIFLHPQQAMTVRAFARLAFASHEIAPAYPTSCRRPPPRRSPP